MKTKNASWLFATGALVGLCFALCLGAVEKNQPPAKDWSRLKVVAYPNGATGFFDPDSGTIYVYDADLARCYLIRKLGNLGQPLFRP